MKQLILILSFLALLFSCEKRPGPYDFEVLTTKGFIDTKEWRGNAIIVFFGYTHCPHICPTVFKTVNQLNQENLKVVFISVDHHRDTLEHLQKHQMIGKHIYAVGAHETVLKSIAKKFETDFEVKLNKDGEPLVNHASHVFIIDPTGTKKMVLDYDSTPEAFKEAINSIQHHQPPVETNRFPPVLASNEECDLGVKDCTIRLKDSEFTLEFKQRPVQDNDYQTLLLSTNSTQLLPIHVDIEGIDLNMGLIRPRWLKERQGQYSSSFRLPFCEIPTMRWKASILVRDQNNQESLLRYSFQTKHL